MFGCQSYHLVRAGGGVVIEVVVRLALIPETREGEVWRKERGGGEGRGGGSWRCGGERGEGDRERMGTGVYLHTHTAQNT